MKDAKTKIVLFSNLFPNCMELERGIFTYQIVRHLRKLCNLEVVSPLPFYPKNKVFSVVKKWWAFSQVPFTSNYEGIEVFYPKFFTLPKLGDYVAHWFLGLRFLLFLKRRFGNQKPSLINAHWIYPDGVAATMVGQRLNIPVVISLLGSDINRDIHNRHLQPLILKALNNCSKIISVSDEIKKTIISHGIDEQKIVVINNGVDSEKFRIYDKVECQEKFGLSQNNKYILFVGRLEQVKGVEVLINAVGEYSTQLQGTKIILVGDGALTSSLQQRVDNLGLSDFFLFAGAQPYSLIPLWMSCADVFCLPSLNEGHPNVVMEALASGCPVVASRVGAIEKYVTPDCGYVFPPGDFKKLGMLLSTCLSREWVAEDIRKTVENHSWGKVANMYFQEFEETLKGIEQSRCNKA